MRTTTTLFLGLFSATAVLRAQAPGDSLYMFFDDTSDNLQLDSVYPAGCWQVGAPSKPVFTSAHSPGKALVTDTLLPYPDSTTCYAEFTLIATDETYTGRGILFKQRCDMDSTSSAAVEVRGEWDDSWHRFGTFWTEVLYINWDDPVNDGAGYSWTGQSEAWEEVWLESPCPGVLMHADAPEQRWYEPIMRVRFAFESQGNPNARDGWMIDNVRAGVIQCFGGITEETTGPFTISPNPAEDRVTLALKDGTTKGLQVEMRRSDGALVNRQLWPGSRTMTLWTDGLPNGLYFVSVQSEGQASSSRVIIQH